MRVTGILWERLAVGRAVRRTFRRKSSGSALLSDAPPLPREEQTPRAVGHAGTPGRARGVGQVDSMQKWLGARLGRRDCPQTRERSCYCVDRVPAPLLRNDDASQS